MSLMEQWDTKFSIHRVDSEGDTLLIAAARYGETRNAAYLIGKGVRVDHQNHKGADALMMSAEFGRTKIVKMLLQKRKLIVKQQDVAGFNALMFAVCGGHIEIVDLLIQTRAPIDHQNKVGRNAVMMAADREQYAILETLLQRGAKADLSDKHGLTALMMARTPQTAELLINYGAHVAQEDELGNTPLMWAAFRGKLDVVQLLLEKGANPKKRNRMKQNAFDLAKMQKRSEVMDFLKAWSSPQEFAADESTEGILSKSGQVKRKQP